MKSRHLTGLAILSTVTAMISVCYVLSYVFRFPGDRGRAYDSWESSNEVFKVRMTAYHEVGIFMPGAFYSFESAAVGSDEWQEFKVFRGDDAIRISPFKERFSFVDSQTAYIYNADEFLVTRDSGRNWFTWKPLLPEPDGRLVYWAIQKAQVEPNGLGRATLLKYDQQKGVQVELEVFTPDFGRDWYQIAGRNATLKR